MRPLLVGFVALLFGPAGLAQDAWSGVDDSMWTVEVQCRLGTRGVVERAPTPGTSGVTGAALRFPGFVIEHHRFATPEQAYEVAVTAGSRERPLVSQVRGSELVLLRGPRLADPAVARRMLDAAWAGPGRPRASVTGVLLPGEQLFITTTDLQGELDRQLLDAFRRVRAELARDPRRTDMALLGPRAARLSLPGVRSELRVSEGPKPRAAFSLVARSQADEAALRAWVRVFAVPGEGLRPDEGTSAPAPAPDPGQAAAKGAAKVLGDLLRR